MAFSEQEWPGKKVVKCEGQGQKNSKKEAEETKRKGVEMTFQESGFLEQLLEEMTVQTSWQNNDGKPVGELKLLDQDALEQLESRLSVDDQSVYLSATSNAVDR